MGGYAPAFEDDAVATSPSVVIPHCDGADGTFVGGMDVISAEMRKRQGGTGKGINPRDRNACLPGVGVEVAMVTGRQGSA